MKLADVPREELVQLIELIATEVYARVKESHARSSTCKLILVQPMDAERFSSEVLRELHTKGITVIPVARRALEAPDGSLGETILKRLGVLEHLRALEQTTKAPEVDAEAARIVEDAMQKMSPANPDDRQKFLDDFYGGIT